MPEHFISMMKCEILFFLFCVLLDTVVYSLDVSWIPTDPDGPLPLSSRYRDALQKLCNQMSSGQKLHPDVDAKRAVLKKLCAKLESSSMLTVDIFKNIPVREILLTCLVVGGGTYAWTQRRAIYRYIRYKAIPALSIRGGQIVGEAPAANNVDIAAQPHIDNINPNAHAGPARVNNPIVNPAPVKREAKPLVDMAAVREARMKHFANAGLPSFD